MIRLPEIDLTEKSVKYAGDYVNSKFKTGRDIEKNLVLNSLAHGFFTGARYVESCHNKPLWKFWVKTKWSDEELVNQGIKASAYYLKKRFRKVDFMTFNLVKASNCNAFCDGVRFREKNG